MRERTVLEDNWQIFKKMLIGVISKGEAGQGREGTLADRQTDMGSLCLRDKVERRNREGRRKAAIMIQIVENNKIPQR